MSEAPDHYFTAQPASAAEIRPMRVTLAGRSIEVLTAAGVFSAGKVDPGTSVLLSRVSDPPTDIPGDLLDLGCGWGPIALDLALSERDRVEQEGGMARTVWAVDVNERALDLLDRTASRLNLPMIRAVTADQVPSGTSFALIRSNPPIRVGKAQLHALLATWLPRLTVGGHAELVVGKNLGADSLQQWLQDQMSGPAPSWGIRGTVERRASAKGFRVLDVTRLS